MQLPFAKVSVIGLGTWQLGGEWGHDYTQAEADAIFDKARECGINLIDTAECYGDHTSERLIGGAIQRDREKWIVCTKFGHKFNAAFQRDTVYDPRLVIDQLDKSLAALRTDYIDLYQFHSGNDAEFDTHGLWDTLAKEKEKGRVRHLGISIGNSITTAYQAEHAKERGAEALQVVYNRLERKPEDLWFPIAGRDRLGVLARVPLASGYLSGKYKPGATFPPGDMRAGMQSAEKRERQIAEAQRIAVEEVPAGVPMSRWALAWCLKNPVVSAVIPGCKSPQQVEDNALAAGLVA